MNFPPKPNLIELEESDYTYFRAVDISNKDDVINKEYIVRTPKQKPTFEDLISAWFYIGALSPTGPNNYIYYILVN